MNQVVIIGGGLSGLLTAFRLQQAGISYLLFEARDRLGGRIHTVEADMESTIEMGATWFSGKHQKLLSLLSELDIPFEVQYQGDQVLYDYENNGRHLQRVELPKQREESYLLSEGSSSLVTALFQRLDPSKVHLTEAVSSLTFSDKVWKVVSSKRIVEGDVLISTLPPNLFVNSITIQPRLPEELIKVSKQTHTWMGESIKAGISMRTTPWRDQSVGSILSQFGPFSEIHDHTHQNQRVPKLKGFIHEAFRHLHKDERKQRITEQLQRYFPNQSMALLAYLETDWQNEPFTYHPYEGNILPHQNNGHPIFRKLLYGGHFFFAGSETAQLFPGYMEGAVQRSEYVSLEIIRHFSKSLTKSN